MKPHKETLEWRRSPVCLTYICLMGLWTTLPQWRIVDPDWNPQGILTLALNWNFSSLNFSNLKFTRVASLTPDIIIKV